MHRALPWLLGLVGVAGLALFLSFEGDGGHGRSSFRMGQPDAWIVWEQGPDGNQFSVSVVRWSFGAGFIGLYCLFHAVRLARKRVSRPYEL